jgi:hypothetical protein
MQCLGIGVRNNFGHTLDVAPLCLKKAFQVLLGLTTHIASSQAKERRIFLAISQEPRSQLFQGRRWDMASLFPVTTLLGVAWIDDPRSRSFAPYYARQVPAESTGSGI